MLELHCHTTYSDGTLTPPELVAAALKAGVKALAITDHDTIAGWDEAFAAAADAPLEIVPGLELSTVYNNRSMHILGFYPEREKLLPPLQARLESRQRRAHEMVEKLAALGYSIELPPMAGNAAPGRPHIAAALVKAGYIKHPQEAFDRWLGETGSAYVQHEQLSAEEGIRLLLDCGAVPVWAHPYLFRGGTVATVLPKLVAAGLKGVEVYHPHHSPSEERKLEEACDQYGLVMTGGSDYHGPASDGGSNPIRLNQLKVPMDLLPPLKAAAA
jgi:3',5'-nucleoside bisphosphate phosphatase